MQCETVCGYITEAWQSVSTADMNTQTQIRMTQETPVLAEEQQEGHLGLFELE